MDCINMEIHRKEVTKRVKRIVALHKEVQNLIALEKAIVKDLEEIATASLRESNKEYLDNVRHRILRMENELKKTLGI